MKRLSAILPVLMVLMLIFVACDDKPSSPVHDNPYDSLYTETEDTSGNGNGNGDDFYFFDGFESGNIFTGNWQRESEYQGEILVTDTTAFTGNYGVYIGNPYRFYRSIPDISSGDVHITFNVRSSKNNIALMYFLVFNENHDQMARVYMGDNGNWGITTSAGDFDVFYPYVAGVWYQVELILHIEDETFDFYINGDTTSTDQEMINPGKVSEVRFAGGQSADNPFYLFYIALDDIEIKQITGSPVPDEQTIFYDGFESGNTIDGDWMMNSDYTGEIAVIDSNSSLGNLSVHLGAPYRFYRMIEDLHSGDVSISFDVWVPSNNLDLMFFLILNDTEDWIARIFMADDGSWGVNAGSTDDYYYTGFYEPYVWQSVEIILHMQTETFDFYVNGSVLRAGDQFINPGPVSEILFAEGAVEDNPFFMYYALIDEVKITQTN
ncbi:MAG: hypothetical protein P9L92_06780 [Candidatus Electryonea clarkiae]|nr:hypothetical protein [Candidatus Electryonea clarkiae]MDP8286702.1 hypothetical protein [Candidatus Electryonea clarkiae]